MDPYTAGERLNDLCSDVLVAGHLARDRKLRPDYADALAVRVRTASADMVEDSDAQLLRSTANALSALSTRIKSAEVRARGDGYDIRNYRVKAAPAPGPSIKDLVKEWDRERMAGGSASSRDPDVEAARLAEMNRQLAERNRRAEEQRRR